MNQSLKQLRSELKAAATPERAKVSQWFFKTGPGQYGEGDQFMGITVPVLRSLCKRYRELGLSDIDVLIKSPWHEERQAALFILVWQYGKADAAGQEAIYRFYIDHAKFVNNWDLVDSSAEFIVGPHIDGRAKETLDRLAGSDSVWERRIAVLATFHYIKQGRAEEILRLAEQLLEDKHDLIQKAVGWMLREVGKKCGQDVEEKFLLKHYKMMPRTMLRYAIERFPDERRLAYLKGTV